MKKLLSTMVLALLLVVSLSVRADDAQNNAAGSIQEHRKEMQFLAQQRSIRAMAEALYMKKTLDLLGALQHDIGSKLSNNYGNEKEVIATLIARRGLYNALLTLKYQVATIRARLRSEAMEMDVLPIATPNEIVTSPVLVQHGAKIGVTAGN